MADEQEERELTTTEGLIKVILAAAAGFIAKKIVEDAFRRRRP
jgi:hypothetical protein